MMVPREREERRYDKPDDYSMLAKDGLLDPDAFTFDDDAGMKPNALAPANSRIQKRYFCRHFFVYNPVTGRCQPTLRVNI